MVYCVVPRQLVDKLHDALREHFRDEPTVEVIAERRFADRRDDIERRQGPGKPPAAERRRIRNVAGRRIGDRRATSVAAAAHDSLPRAAQRHADQLLFVERFEPSDRRLEDIDTTRLVVRFQHGDKDAFAQLYTRYFDRVYGYLRSLLSDPHAAEDATQDVFAKTLEALDGYEFRGLPFRSWLMTIARNRALDHLRRTRRLSYDSAEALERQLDREAQRQGGDLDVLRWISDRELLMFIDRLPVPQREALLFRFMLDLDTRQVGELMGRSDDDVRALQSRALRFLRARLEAVGRTPTEHGRIPLRRLPRDAYVLRRRRFAMLSR